MKKIAIVLFALAAVGVLSVSAQAQNAAKPAGNGGDKAAVTAAESPFEGMLQWAMFNPAQYGDSDRHDMSITMKGEKTLVDMDGGMQGKVRIYADKGAKKMYIVMVDANMGMEQPYPDEEQMEKAAAKMPDVDLKPTGRTESIAGRKADAYELKGEAGTTSTFWMTKEIAPEMRAAYKAATMRSMKGSAKQKAAFKKLADQGLFPVKIETKDQQGDSMYLEFVKLEQKSISDDTFDLPKGVQMQPAPGAPGAAPHGAN